MLAEQAYRFVATRGTLITSAEEGGYVFTSVCLSVCLSVRRSDNWKSCERILTKFLRGVGHDPGTKWLNFDDDPDHRPVPGVRSPKSGFTGLSKSTCLVDSDQSCIADFHCKTRSANARRPYRSVATREALITTAIKVKACNYLQAIDVTR